MAIAAKKQRVSRALTVLVALLLAVGPLGLLQVVAWTGMAFNYGTRYGVTEGLGRTFDGQHPCSLCKEITKTRADNKESPSAVAVTPVKVIGVLSVIAQCPTAELSETRFAYYPASDFFTTRSDRPASPPPRTLAA